MVWTASRKDWYGRVTFLLDLAKAQPCSKIKSNNYLTLFTVS